MMGTMRDGDGVYEQVKNLKYRDGFGVELAFGVGADFEVLGLSIHTHAGDTEEVPCQIRHGILLTFMNVKLVVGWLRHYLNPEQE
jgi:hypothetical protein